MVVSPTVAVFALFMVAMAVLMAAVAHANIHMYDDSPMHVAPPTGN